MLLGKYQETATTTYGNNWPSSIIENEEEQRFYAQWVVGLPKDSRASKKLLDQLRLLRNSYSIHLPQLIDDGWDEEKDAYCFVYTYKELQPLDEQVEQLPPTLFLKGMEQIADSLRLLNKATKLQHGYLTPQSIYLDEDLNFHLRDIGLLAAFEREDQEVYQNLLHKEFAAPETYQKTIEKGFPYQQDIYGIGQLIEWYFDTKEIEEPAAVQQLLDRICSEQPKERGSYGQLIEDLQAIAGAIPPSEPEENRVVVIDGHSLVVEDLNDSDWRPKYNLSPSEGSHILMYISTKNYWLKCLWLLDAKQLTIMEQLDLEKGEDKENKHQQTLKYGQELGLSISYQRGGHSSFDLTPVFNRIKKAKHGNEYKTEKRKIGNQLKFYKELIKKELEVMEKNSLRLQYTSFEKQSETELWIALKENNKYSKDDHIETHIDKANPPNEEYFEYILHGNSNRKQLKDPVRFSGVAYNYDRQSRILKFKDCEGVKFDQIPKAGFLWENIARQEEEKKRQQQAIQKVEQNKVENRDLIRYLFHADQLTAQALSEYELQQIYQTDDTGKEFQYSDNQTRALLNALYREPLTVIQGPPGTGKTTVITELVFQILAQQPHARILITSQTNSAVDNVLDNLLKEKIPLIRLSGVRKPKPSLQKHTLERKIQGWKEEVQRKARAQWKAYQSSFFQQVESDKESLLLTPILENFLEKGDWNKRKVRIEKLMHLFKGAAYATINLDSEATCIESLQAQSKLGINDFFRKRRLHLDWLTAISTLNEESKLNQKLVDSIGVFGATTNHVASKKYAKYNFSFDYVIMDESGKATIAESLIPIVMAKKLVLVGDHRQLRPMMTANREVEKWLREKYKKEVDHYDSWEDYFNRASLFEEVIEDIAEEYKSQLEECRRMPEEAVRLTSSCFYEPFGDQPIKPVQRAATQEHRLPLKREGGLFFLDIGNALQKYHRSQWLFQK